ncbi:hypothetical protein [Luteipulveratus halotolerans]|uniref:Lipoprotein n=1 Tax=Luteipulveratus halotolerans TaxID=1631356 RepID=A0A0L6CKR2_9MICO|nr:hypothetical protein [Luteipulveratus halotolerans]KNX38347.1 hypothetical protein VV01_16250 [Luteipulveratus halotolerans]
MRRTSIATAVLAGSALLVSGCSGDADEPVSSGAVTPSSTSGAAPAPAGDPQAGGAYLQVEPGSASTQPVIATKSKGGSSFTLTAVRRIGPDRVVVEGLASRSQPNAFNEQGYFGAEHPIDGGGHFGGLSLKRSGDTSTYLPVRSQDRTCQCTVFHPELEKPGTPEPVYVVMSAPAGAGPVTVTVDAVGTFSNVPIS